MPNTLTPVPLPMRTDEQIIHFTLGEMFPVGHVFALHLARRTLTHLCVEAQIPAVPRLVAQAYFSERELDLIRPLYTTYPQLVPYEVMWVSFYRGFAHLDERAVVQARHHLQQAHEEGRRAAELQAMWNTIGRVRPKLHEIGLELGTINDTGYLLLKHPQS